MKTIGHGIVINASPSAVWRNSPVRSAATTPIRRKQTGGVLMDWPRFAEWNSFLIELEGEPRLGSRLSVRIDPPDGKPIRFRPTLTALEPDRDFNGSNGRASQGCATGGTRSA